MLERSMRVVFNSRWGIEPARKVLVTIQGLLLQIFVVFVFLTPDLFTVEWARNGTTRSLGKVSTARTARTSIEMDLRTVCKWVLGRSHVVVRGCEERKFLLTTPIRQGPIWLCEVTWSESFSSLSLTFTHCDNISNGS